MFEKVFSSAEKLVEAGEEIGETRYRSRLAPSYLKQFMGAGGLAILASGAMVIGDMSSLLPPFIPSEYVMGVLVVPVLVVLWIEIEHHSLMYHFTDKRLIEEHGVFSKSFSSVPYKDITRVRISQNPTERILGIGHLRVEVKGTDTEEVIIDDVRRPQQFRMKLTAQKEAHQGGQEGEQGREKMPQVGTSFTKEHLEAELGRIHRRRQQLEQQYQDGQLSEPDYEREWYMLQGEERVVERQLDELEAQ